jgi:integrase
MSMLAPTLQAFFADRLARQRNASPHTIAAYRDTLRLLLTFAQQRTGKQPCHLDLDAPLIGAFLDHLEHERHNSIRTRNARLAAIRSLFHYAALEHPEHAETINRVLAIPPKRFERALVTFLTEPEIDALLAAPDRDTWTGRRDHAMLLLAIQTGLTRPGRRSAALCTPGTLARTPPMTMWRRWTWRWRRSQPSMSRLWRSWCARTRPVLHMVSLTIAARHECDSRSATN